jgi:hypothetical protein
LNTALAKAIEQYEDKETVKLVRNEYEMKRRPITLAMSLLSPSSWMPKMQSTSLSEVECC